MRGEAGGGGEEEVDEGRHGGRVVVQEAVVDEGQGLDGGGGVGPRGLADVALDDAHLGGDVGRRPCVCRGPY